MDSPLVSEVQEVKYAQNHSENLDSNSKFDPRVLTPHSFVILCSISISSSPRQEE